MYMSVVSTVVFAIIPLIFFSAIMIMGIVWLGSLPLHLYWHKFVKNRDLTV